MSCDRMHLFCPLQFLSMYNFLVHVIIRLYPFPAPFSPSDGIASWLILTPDGPSLIELAAELIVTEFFLCHGLLIGEKGWRETSCAIFYSAAGCALGTGGSQEGKGEVQSVVTLNPPDCGYINFFPLCRVRLMFCRLTEDDLPYMKTRMSSVVFRRAMTALCCSRIRKMETPRAGCQWKNQQI